MSFGLVELLSFQLLISSLYIAVQGCIYNADLKSVSLLPGWTKYVLYFSAVTNVPCVDRMAKPTDKAGALKFVEDF